PSSSHSARVRAALRWICTSLPAPTSVPTRLAPPSNSSSLTRTSPALHLIPGPAPDRPPPPTGSRPAPPAGSPAPDPSAPIRPLHPLYRRGRTPHLPARERIRRDDGSARPALWGSTAPPRTLAPSPAVG